uniref:Uncharacterized protein n=1 Tax=Cannabis sativa TaxID=3483 RepID=A0A803R5M2_CANSA
MLPRSKMNFTTISFNNPKVISTKFVNLSCHLMRKDKYAHLVVSYSQQNQMNELSSASKRKISTSPIMECLLNLINNPSTINCSPLNRSQIYTKVCQRKGTFLHLNNVLEMKLTIMINTTKINMKFGFVNS